MTTEVSPQDLFTVISDATSQDPSRVQVSAKRLKELFQQPGVYDALHTIAATKTLPLDIRIQASLQFKNEALKNWKSRKLQTPQNRDNIRRRCLTFLDEQDTTIADCNKVAVSKIARADFPETWPSLIDELMAEININLSQRYILGVDDPLSILKLQRALQLLCGVTKEFSSMKMLNGVQTMKKIFDHLHLTINDYFSKVLERVQISLNPQNFENPSLYADLIISHLLFKILVTLAAWIWQQSSRMSEEERQLKVSWLAQVFHNSIQQLQGLVLRRAEIIKLQTALPNSRALMVHQILTKHIRRFGKFYLRMASVDPKRMAELSNCSDVVMFYWNQIVEAANNLPKIEDQPAALFPVRFLVQGLVIFKDLFGQWRPQRRDGTPNKNILTAEFIGEAVKVIVGSLLPLTQADLRGLDDDPEEWVSTEEQDNQQWEYELRSCSERVLTQLSNQYPEYVTPLLTQVFMDAVKPGSNIGVSNKEALYCAIGRCCQRMKGEIHFEDWVNQILIAEVQLPSESDPFVFLLHRRIAWVLGKWMSESCCSPNMPAIWQILLHLLSQRGRGSTVIRLTAAVALREGVDTLDFNPEEFAPFLSAAVTELMSLIGEANTFDSKRKVDDALNVVIDRVGVKIIPLVSLISGPIPALWMEAGDDWLFKSSLLVTMTNLVKAIGAESVGLSHIVVPLVQDSMNQGLNLDGDGVNLWRDAMRNTVTIDNPDRKASLSSLIPLLVQHLNNNLELLGTLLQITESYFLLDPLRMLQIDAVALLQVFLAIIQGPAIRQNKTDALGALTILVQLTPSSLWGESMHTSGLFPYLLDVFIIDEEDTQILCQIEYLFARIVLSDCPMFLQLVSAATPLLKAGKESSTVHIPLTETKVYDLFLDRWWGTFDAMSQPRHRKLVAMGTAVLVSTGRQEILSRLHSEFFNLWMDVFGEIKEAQNPPTNDDGEEVPSILTLYWEKGDAPASYYQGSEGTPEYERRKVIFERDPVRTEQLSVFVGARLREAQNNCGPNFQQYLKNADPTVLEHIRAEVSM